MIETSRIGHSRGIAFLGTYLPQHCGIATFTHDLSTAVEQQAGRDQHVSVVAMKDRPEGYDYSDRVKFEIRRDYQIDYARAADFLNFSRTGVLSLQHEYGIFGGEAGSNLLTLLRDLRKPVVVTCHTVLHTPKPEQKEVFEEILSRADRVVVMTKKAFEILEDTYSFDTAKAVLIPHGIHDVPFVDPNYYKDKFGVEGRRVLLTFGLLSRNKGIENVIEALPEIVKKHPRTTYLVLGATHPGVVKEEGESYRLELQRRLRELGLEEHVLFHPRFVELDELMEYIGASDMFIAPYHNMDQITSGALSYAMGAGKAVVATPFWHAQELLDEGRGVLVPVKDSKAFAREINRLLDDEVQLTTVRKRAYMHCRHMIWPAVARSYLEIFDAVRRETPVTMATASALRRPIAASNLPAPKIDHLERLTDDTGPAHHARYTIPEWRFGYRLEDASASLVAAIKHSAIFNDERSQRLAQTYLSLIDTLVAGDTIAEELTYSRVAQGTASDATLGMTMWALGYAARQTTSRLAEPSLDRFNELLGRVRPETPRGAAYFALGAGNYLRRFPGASDVRRLLAQCTTRLSSFVAESDWPDRWGDVDWPVCAQALWVSARETGSDDDIELARAATQAMLDRTEGGRVFQSGDGDVESPVTAATFIEALGASFQWRRDESLLKPVRAAADWFLGANRPGFAVYDFATGGCCDAVMSSGANKNQGTGATAFGLLALLTLHRLASVETSAGSASA